MALKLYNDSDIQDIADAIRYVNGSSNTYKASEMAAEIRKFSYNASVLPSGYQQVEYIANTESCAINTSYVPVLGDTIQVEFYPTSRKSYHALFSAGGGTYQTVFLLDNNASDGRSYFKYFGSGSATGEHGGSAVFDNWFLAEAVQTSGGGQGTITKISDSTTAVTINATNPTGAIDGSTRQYLQIFSRVDGSSPLVGRIRSTIVSNGGVEKVHLIPCYRIADGVIGMYDIVSDSFITNSGTGTLTKGADV